MPRSELFEFVDKSFVIQFLNNLQKDTSADNPHLGLDYSGYHKTLIQ